MAMLSRMRMRLRGLFVKSRVEDELQTELQFHLEREIEQNIVRGMSPEAARTAALRSFGGFERVKEESRDIRGGRLLGELWQDMRYGARIFVPNPSFTLVAVITLALGIGANAAIFSLINALLLTPLPYDHAEQIVDVSATMRRKTVEVRSLSYPDYVDWRDQRAVFEQLAAHAQVSFSLTGDAEPERVNGELASASYFPLLRVNPAIGRTFLPEEDVTPDAHRVAIVSNSLWLRRFGGRPDLVGRTIQLNDGNYTVIGIMPEDFRGDRETVAGDQIRMYRHQVSPGFFSTLGIRLIKGRDFTAEDQFQTPGVVVISDAMARRYWPDQDDAIALQRLASRNLRRSCARSRGGRNLQLAR
jgi:hypothetical protein